jgi:hypothetical protein
MYNILVYNNFVYTCEATAFSVAYVQSTYLSSYCTVLYVAV